MNPVTDQVIPVREIYWNLPHWIESFLYVTAILAIGVMFYKMYQDVVLWRKGPAMARADSIGLRFWNTTTEVLGQKRVLRDRIPGIMHTFIFYGFLALFIGTEIIAAEADFTIPLAGEEAGKILTGGFYVYYELILDVMGMVFFIGLMWAAIRRYQKKPTRLDNRRTDAWVLGSMLFIAVGGYLIEGLRLANQTMPYTDVAGNAQQAIVYEQSWAKWAVFGYPLAGIFQAIGLGVSRAADGTVLNNGTALLIHQILWMTHMLVVFAFVASIPFSKFRHIMYTPLNNLLRDRGPKGALDLIPNMEAELEKDEPKLGVHSLGDFSWKRRMDFDACMRCGRCQDNCPAFASGSELSPKWLITKMSDLMHGGPVLKKDGTVVMVQAKGAGLHSGGETAASDANNSNIRFVEGNIETIGLYENDIVTENELWACTTCRACMTECPATIEHVDDIIDLRRNLTMVLGEIPAGVKTVLQGIERNGNPWKLPQRNRTAWADGLDVPTLAEKENVDVLYWVGCAPSYDDRSKKTARAMVQLMQKAGVDFAILGDEETCTGDPARRMGEELLYEMQASTNIETMKQYTFKKVVTTCAHCFNTIKNEYPQFGGTAGVDYQVVHHTEYLNDLVEAGKLKPAKEINQKVVYHDPCYVGRYNDIYEEPRNVLQHIPGIELVEAGDRNRSKAMCCGGGGGNAWLEGWGTEGVNVIRLEQLQTEKPDTVAMGCPFCMVMFEDAAKNTGQDETLGRKDVAELLLESVGAPTPPAA